jgi:hypothetical protein
LEQGKVRLDRHLAEGSEEGAVAVVGAIPRPHRCRRRRAEGGEAGAAREHQRLLRRCHCRPHLRWGMTPSPSMDSSSA